LWEVDQPNSGLNKGYSCVAARSIPARGAHIAERVSVPATDCGRISARVLAEEKANAGDKWYRQEYLCEFVDIDGAVFPRDTIDGAYQDYEGLAL